MVLSHRWSGEGVDEIGKNAQTGQTVVRVDPRYFRPSEVE
jgi:GDPmannose 4,6-dehydratase